MITVITTWYNERLLAPLFMAHYGRMGRVIVMLDADTNDGTDTGDAEVLQFKNEDGWDAFEHAKRQMALYKSIPAGYVLFVDADEFIFPLPELTDDAYAINFAQVFRHLNDADIDYTQQPLYQRRHGVTATKRCPATLYTKPCLIKAGLNVSWEVVGHHQLHGDYTLSDTLLFGTHWQMADPEIALERNVNNRVGRNGLQNRMLGAAAHFDAYTVESVMAECAEHLHDKRLF